MASDDFARRAAPFLIVCHDELAGLDGPMPRTALWEHGAFLGRHIFIGGTFTGS
jgi:hypothetical protein